jgi:hypothetical protein
MRPLQSRSHRAVCASVLASLLLFARGVAARECRVDLIPNGTLHRCANCHVDPQGGGARNPFGSAVGALVTPGSCAQFWGASLASLDSDGDGRTNGAELQDPAGAWRPGFPPPGDPDLVTLPGVPDDPPAAEIRVVPRALDFGAVELGVSRVLAVEARNLGGRAFEVIAVSLDPSTSAEFAIAAGATAVEVPAGGRAVIEVAYAPSDEGADSGRLRIAHDAPNEASPIAVALFGSTPPPPETPFRRGDGNGDGRIDIGDGIRLLDHLFRGAGIVACRDAGDANDSGGLDLADPVYLFNWLFRGGPAPPPPGAAECGSDPTEDELRCAAYSECG